LVALLSAPLVFVLVQQPTRLGTRRARPARNAIFTVSTEPGSKVHFASLTLLQLTNHEDIASREPGCGKNSQPIRPYIFFSHKGRQKGSRPNKCQCCTHGLEPWRFRAGLGPVATTNKQVLLRFTQGPHVVVRSFSQGRRFRLAVDARPHQNRARGTSSSDSELSLNSSFRPHPLLQLLGSERRRRTFPAAIPSAPSLSGGRSGTGEG